MRNKTAEFIFLIFSALAFQNANAQTNCHSDEDVFFSCQVGKKIVSMCASSKVETAQYLEYRFGTPMKIELRYRGLANDGPMKFNRVEIVGASNSGTTIWFKNYGIDYVLNAPVRGGPYLEVIKDGKRLSRLACKDEWAGVEGDLDSASNTIATKTKAEFFAEVLRLTQ